MSDFKDKDETFVFKSVPEEKPHIDRTEDDKFSYARKSVEYEEEEEDSTSPLVITAIVLAVILIVTIIGGVIYLSGINKGKQQTEEKPPIVNVEEEEKEEEEEIIETDYNLIFDSEQIFYMENGKGYAVSTVFFDTRDKFIKKEMTYVTDETVIKDNGKRISVEAFINVIKNQGGDLIMFDSRVREEDSLVLTINYDSRTFVPEEIPEENSEETTPEETTPEEEIKEEENPSEENPSAEVSPEDAPSEPTEIHSEE